MFSDVPMPELDLRRMRRLEGDVPRAVLEVLVEGLEQTADAARGDFTSLVDDDDSTGRPSTFGYGPPHDRKTLPARKARDAWRLAVEQRLVPASMSAWRGRTGPPASSAPRSTRSFACGSSA